MEDIKLLCWNCRGSANPKTVARIRALMRNLKPDVMCLVETRADENRALKLCEKFTKHWEWAAIPAIGMSGGIITLWNPRVGQVTPIAFSRFSLHLVISTTAKPKEWVFSIVYNSQNIYLQKFLWHELSAISTLNLPWIISGDFNAILNSEEHRGGSFSNYSVKAKHFNDFINSNHLFDLGFFGPSFTWCNNQNGLARRWARLDLFLANNDWLTNFDSYHNKHLPRTCSDHSPMFLSANFFSHRKKKVFRFENFWFEHAQCHNSVHKAWNFKPNTSPMHAFTHSIARTRIYLNKWKVRGLSPIDRTLPGLKLEFHI
ncbi:hypothetical protein J5N97_019066 [Dioscorea zingiberensis]|uniref:Endonuclease/exonuclease/phosphatase domain-containing protein n=1 Tax=Dioscorea zingiberensis TaxID=325984 RepID=A0A9D5CD96_9LILI|nr:hypothetical protein J5N97_019066 [Dioscorea zingiberensis]